MKVVILGAGGMGEYAARQAAAYPFVNQVLVADINKSAAEALATQLNGKGQATKVDILDPEQLDSVLAGADFVLNTSGPFFKLGVPALKGAIRAGVHYADICDDWEPTIDMLALSREAAEKDVLALIGIGASPGVTNLLAVMAAQQLEKVDILLTGWPISAGTKSKEETEEITSEPTAEEPSAAIIHWMQQLSGTIRTKKEGKFGDHLPLERLEIDYPKIGTFDVWTVGHPEAITLPEKFKSVRQSANVMVGPSKAFERLGEIADQINSGRASLEEAGRQVAAGLPGGGSRPPRISVFAWAKGEKDGAQATIGATIYSLPGGGMGGSTGVPLAVVLDLFNAGLITERGVCAPEAAIDPSAFFDRLAPLCEGDFKSSADLISVTSKPE